MSSCENSGELPAPPAGLPLVTIVTPCYNAAAYLTETIESVLSQDYPRIEYLVMDAGSTDGTLAILERYPHRLHYTSAPDAGTADAINRGFRQAQGAIFAWLNADDTYLPGAVSAAVRALSADPSLAAVYGEAWWVDSRGAVLRRYPTRPFDTAQLHSECFICQPACFFRRSAFEAVGRLDPTLHSAFDYDLWIRLARRHRLASLPDYLAASRMHPSSKTLGSRKRVFQEAFLTLKRHYGYIPFHWIHSYCSYRIDHRDQFFEPLQPSIFKYCVALPIGCIYNWKHLGRYWREWFSVMSRQGLRRRLRDGWARVLGPRG